MTSWWQLHTWPSATWLPNKELAAFPPFPSLHLNLRNLHLIKDLARKVARAMQRQSCLPVIPVKARLTWAAPVLLSTFHFNLGYFTLQQRTVLSKPHAWRQHLCSEATPHLWTETHYLLFSSLECAFQGKRQTGSARSWIPSKAAEVPELEAASIVPVHTWALAPGLFRSRSHNALRWSAVHQGCCRWLSAASANEWGGVFTWQTELSRSNLLYFNKWKRWEILDVYSVLRK